MAAPALQRIAWLYRIEQELATASSAERLAGRQQRNVPLWNELHAWLRLDALACPTAAVSPRTIDYSLRRWDALGRFLNDGRRVDRQQPHRKPDAALGNGQEGVAVRRQ